MYEQSGRRSYPSQSDNDVVKEGLIKCFEAKFGERDKQFSIFLKNDLGKVFGGIQAMMDTESVYIDVLWVEESLQKLVFHIFYLKCVLECRFRLIYGINVNIPFY